MSSVGKSLIVLLAFAAVSPVMTATAANMKADSDGSADPRALLFAMTDFLGGAKAFSVKLRTGYEVVQVSGQKLQFLEARDLTLERPGRLRVDIRGGDGRAEALLFNGKMMTIWDAAAGVYAQVAQPGTVDDAIRYFIRDLQMRLPLSELLTTRVSEEVERQLIALEYVEYTNVLGTPAHHLAGRMQNVDFQIWIAAQPQPLPLRIVLIYPEPGLPEFWADFSDWNLQPKLSAEVFDLRLPTEARQIAFAVQLRPEPVTAAPTQGVK